jgi:hypothetical protein
LRYTLYLSNIVCSSFSYFLITTTSFFLLETIKRSFKCEITIVCRNDCFRSSAITKWQITQTTHYSKLYHCKTFLLIGFYSNVKKKRGWSHHFTTRVKSLKIPKGGNQNPYIEEEQTTQWPKEKVQKDKQRSTKHTHKLKIEYYEPQ